MSVSVSASVSASLIHFIGAGPGDPELLTLKAQRLIAEAGVILYAGSLVNPEVLAHARAGAALYNTAGMPLEEQVTVMRAAVERGQSVARLHTGDPSVFGALVEQMRELSKAGLSYTITPGVSSAFAAAAALGIEFTLPNDTQTVMLTRLAGRTPVPDRERLRELAVHRTSMVIFLSAGMIAEVVAELRAAGYADDAPVAIVQRASWPDELIVRGALSDIAAKALAAEMTHQAVIIVSPALGACDHGDEQRSHLYGTALQKPAHQPTTAIVTLTRNGARTGQKLQALLPDSVLYTPARFMQHVSSISPAHRLCIGYTTSVRQVLHDAFQTHEAMVCVMASGIVVRELAPLLGTKHTDPGVVVTDEQGRYAVSLLSGHKGGANELARRVAALLGGQAVITTASDTQELPALDLIGQSDGWYLDQGEYLTAVTGALVNGETVGMFQDAGDESWLPVPPAPNLKRFTSVQALVEAAPAAALLITHRQVSGLEMPAIIYHPRCLAVGVGCNRGTSDAEIRKAIEDALDEAGLSRNAILCAATITHKAAEPGLLSVCAQLGWPLRTYTREEILRVEHLPNPSEWARRALGVPGVAEPAALLAAREHGRDAVLLVEKRKFPNVTVAVAKTG
ncbi:MAG: precorrin-4 C(11)-methyltransferase [Chloroflexi bacterium]|nr:precorrin-4 C(11)-methyltransferase [Chloroflexota bacterium]